MRQSNRRGTRWYGLSRAMIALVLLGVMTGCASPFAPSAEDELAAGRAHFDAGEFDAASSRFESAIRIDPNLAPAHIYLGRTYLAKRRWSAAFESLRQGYELTPAPERAGLVRDVVASLLSAAMANLRSGDFTESIQLLEQARSFDPHSVELSEQLAASFLGYGRELMNRGDLDLAIEQFTRALELIPESIEAYVELVRAWLADGRLQEAFRALLDLLRRYPENEEIEGLYEALLRQ
ncbi:MAG: tetratricopeptide repeat protein [Pseudomonadota bacterium]